jgi:hypothetical protein
MEWGERKRGRREVKRNRLRVLKTEYSQEMRMAWVEKMTVGGTPENV